MSRTAALIPAAGRGERLGQGPKAFLPLGKRSLLQVALAALSPHVDEVVVAVSEATLSEARSRFPEVRFTVGGASRQESVARLLTATEAGTVVIHDAARPFVPASVLNDLLKAARKRGAATAATAVADTLIETATGDTIPRELLRAVQTPQGFRRELLVQAHESATREGTLATDDAALVRALGHPVALVEGSAWLFKVTTPTDYALARALIETWEKRAA